MQGINDPQAANIGASGAQDSASLLTYILDKVRPARESRNNTWKPLWDAYERTYRGQWNESERVRTNERSKLIAPALAQAIDSTAAAIEDAIFQREFWFDVHDDYMDENPADISDVRGKLTEDLNLARAPEAISQCIMNACMLGNGIGKLNVKRITETVINENDEPEDKVRPLVELVPIHPWEFVIDTNARDIDNAFFVAHEPTVPKQTIVAKYKKDPGGYSNPSEGHTSPGGTPVVDPSESHSDDNGACFITEYYGLVPLKYFTPEQQEEVLESKMAIVSGMIEAIVTIANESVLLKAIPSPYQHRDRPIVGYAHEQLPGRFWGRSVSEKGWNAQKALDAELRARMDALALLTSPMMGVDVTRLPRNADMEVRPGKTWFTRGRPSEVLEPVILGNLNPSTFNQSAEMERMVTIGTGAMDSAVPLDQNRRNETASGISMMQSGSMKRLRRTMWNLERQFLNPFLKKTIWRYQQFYPLRYSKDMQFCVKGTQGIVAREWEMAQLTALLSVLPQESPAHGILVRGVIEMSGAPKRDQLLAALDKAAQPDPEQQKQQQAMQALQMKMAELGAAELEGKVAELAAKVQKLQAETNHINIKADLEDDLVEIQAANAATGMMKTKANQSQAAANAQRNDNDRRYKEKDLELKEKQLKQKNKPKGD